MLGVAGATNDPNVVILTGVAGMAAGAFAMAAGEYVSVQSQRELYEYQIALERDELKQYPEAEAQELALIYAAKGLPAKEADRLAQRLVADPELVRITRWQGVMPSYTVGHLARVAAVETALADRPGLRIAGSALRGVGVPDCIADGRRQVWPKASRRDRRRGPGAAARGRRGSPLG